MENITRRSIAFVPEELIEFEGVIKKRGYKNRSEAIRDLMRNFVIEEKTKIGEDNQFATLSMVYDHHESDCQHKLTHIQHHFPGIIISSMHVHISEELCLEVLVLKGKGSKIKDMADRIISLKGVKHGKLVVSGLVGD